MVQGALRVVGVRGKGWWPGMPHGMSLTGVDNIEILESVLWT